MKKRGRMAGANARVGESRDRWREVAAQLEGTITLSLQDRGLEPAEAPSMENVMPWAVEDMATHGAFRWLLYYKINPQDGYTPGWYVRVDTLHNERRAI